MNEKNEPARVVVTDFDMKFGSMVMFMIKWMLAAIPAVIIVAFFVFLAIAVIGQTFK